MEIKDVIDGVSRKFPELDKEALQRKINTVLKFRVKTVAQDGNFTSVVISDGTSTFVGSSKRNPADKSNPKRGRLIALSRAVKTALSELEA